MSTTATGGRIHEIVRTSRGDGKQVGYTLDDAAVLIAESQGYCFRVLDLYIEAVRRNKRQLAQGKRLETHLAYYQIED